MFDTTVVLLVEVDRLVSMLLGKSDFVPEPFFLEMDFLNQAKPIQIKWMKGTIKEPPKITPTAIKALFCQSKIG